MEYLKLSQIEYFTVKAYKGYVWKKWDEVNKKMLTAERYSEGFSKKHIVETVEGKFLDVSNDQMGQMLIASLGTDGMSSVIGQMYNVKTNGKTGMDIRYFINKFYPHAPSTPMIDRAVQAQGVEKKDDHYPTIDESSIPF